MVLRRKKNETITEKGTGYFFLTLPDPDEERDDDELRDGAEEEDFDPEPELTLFGDCP